MDNRSPLGEGHGGSRPWETRWGLEEEAVSDGMGSALALEDPCREYVRMAACGDQDDEGAQVHNELRESREGACRALPPADARVSTLVASTGAVGAVTQGLVNARLSPFGGRSQPPWTWRLGRIVTTSVPPSLSPSINALSVTA